MNQSGDQFRNTQHTIKTTYAFSLILLTISLFLPSCNAKFDIVTFSAVGLMPTAKTFIPTIEIDTNVSAGMMGGDVQSNKPYNIRTDYMDDTFTFASAELKLPMRFQHRIYESPNSMAGGVVVITKSRVIQAEFPDTISRDEAFTLQIEGSFTKDDGSIIPFKIKEKYNMSRDKKAVFWADYVSGC